MMALATAGAGDALVLVGFGALGRIAAACARGADRPVAGCLDDTRLPGDRVEGVAVLGGFDALEKECARDGIGCLPTIANGRVRATLIQRIEAASGGQAALHDPSVWVADSARLGPFRFLNCFSAVFPGASTGPGLILDNNASIGVDAVLDAAVFVGPAAQICRGAVVGARSYIGAGAVVLPEVEIGKDATIGAGAVVRSDVADGTVVAGGEARAIPARR